MQKIKNIFYAFAAFHQVSAKKYEPHFTMNFSTEAYYKSVVFAIKQFVIFYADG